VNPQWTLRRRVTALCLLVAAVLTFLAAGATTTAIANQDQLDNLLESVGPMRAASDNLRTALVAQQMGVRGFVLAGSETDLSNYQAAIAAEQAQQAVILANPSATPAIKDQLARASALARAWRAQVAEPAIAAARRRGPAAGQAFFTDAANRRFDEITRAIQVMQDSIQEVRDDSVNSIKGTSSTLLFVLIVAAILVIASGVGLLLAIQSMVIGPVTTLASQVRSVAGGSYQRAIAIAGPPELQRLADDVDSMRLRIVSDLAKVVEARHQIEEANLLLEQRAAELVRSNRDLEQFAYVASHDLQEPLRKVASFCQLLQRRYAGQLDERADQYIAFAVNGAQRMQRLINDLLAFSRIGRMTPGFTRVDLTQLVAEAAGQNDAGRTQEGAEISWSDLPVVLGEEALLSTLFTNLIGNSLKFRHPDRPSRIRITARRVEEGWEISCVDNGIGIDPEFVDKVFVIFQRLHPRDAYPGTGIGLAVAKKIVEYHGGQIWIDTDFHDGTAIRFTLPMATDPVAEPPTAPVDVEQPAAPVDVVRATEPAERAKQSVA